MYTTSKFQTWADQQKVDLTDIQPTIQNVVEGAKSLHTKITDFHESPGTLSHTDQTALDGLLEASTALVAMAQAISTVPAKTVASPVTAAPKPSLFASTPQQKADKQEAADLKAVEKQEAADQKAAEEQEAEDLKASEKSGHKHSYR